MNTVKNCKCIDVELETPEINAYMGRVIDRGYKKIPIDSELSETSENPVQNKVINAALQNFSEGQQAILQEILLELVRSIIVQSAEDPNEMQAISTQGLAEILQVLRVLIDSKAPITSPIFQNGVYLQSRINDDTRQRAQISANGEYENLFIKLANVNNYGDIIVRGLATPIESNDAATKEYVDNLALVDSEDEV